jgi:2'-5' RNA ligase
LFAALVPPRSVLDSLAAAVAPLRGEDANLRWTGPEQWHVTLAFFGEVDDSTRLSLSQKLARAASRHASLRLSLAGAGGFGSARSARVLWVGVTGDVSALRALAGSVAAAGRRVGIELPETRYRAHVTLARLRTPADVRPVVASLASYSSPSWQASEVALVRSHLAAGEGRRARYETVASWPLREPAE